MYIMKKLLSLILALTLIVTCLSGVCFAADPIAIVTNGEFTKEVFTLDELLAGVKATGLTQIKMLTDLDRVVESGSGQIVIPYTCTIDLNGHTWSTAKCASGNAMAFNISGSDSSHSVVKNGTILGATMGIRASKGSLEVQNCTIVAPTSVAVGIYGTDKTETWMNLIKDSTLIAGGSAVFSWHSDKNDQADMTMKIENSRLIQTNPESYAIFTRNAGPSSVEIGENVEVYSAGNLCIDTVKMTGTALNIVDGAHTVEANGQKYEGLKKWTTEVPKVVEPAAPAAPSVPTTPIPDAEVPKTGMSVLALGSMAMASLAGAVLSKKRRIH